MSSRRNIIGQKNNFGSGEDDMQIDLLNRNPHITDGLRAKEGEKVVARPISIFEIVPDAQQPRRVLPAGLMASWNGDPHTIIDVLRRCLTHTNRELAGQKSLEWFISLPDESDWPENPQPYTRALLELGQLASNIAEHGLINPITVIRLDEHWHQIETGERRWFAFHLLYILTGEERWSKIPARTVDQFDAFRQAAENSARQNLNAISRARQYAVLLMALNTDQLFTPRQECDSDRAYYAQAIGLRIPHGQGNAVLKAMGVKSRGQLSSYRDFLKLPDNLWDRADDENWPESKLFSTLNNSDKRQESPQLPAPAQEQLRLASRTGTALKNAVIGKAEMNDSAFENLLSEYAAHMRAARKAAGQ